MQHRGQRSGLQGQEGVMGSTQIDAVSVHLWTQESMHMHEATQGGSIYVLHANLQKHRGARTSSIRMELLGDPWCADTSRMRRDPGCVALVIFSSNRTGYHPHSQCC